MKGLCCLLLLLVAGLVKGHSHLFDHLKGKGSGSSYERLPPINRPRPPFDGPNVLLHLSTLKSTHAAESLLVEGEIPEWVNGVMLRNGFAKFEAEKMHFNFLFDVAGGLYRFEVRGDNVTFTNRFLESNYYKHAMETGVFPDTVTFGATTPESRCGARNPGFPECMVHDNLQVNILNLGEEYFAVSDFRPLGKFDPVTLEFLGDHRFDDDLDELLYMITGAHGSPQPGTDYTINYLGKVDVPLMRNHHYDFYKVKDATPGSKREMFARIYSDELAYIHSFAITENYIVFSEFPLVYDIARIPLTGGPLIDLLKWKPERGTKMTVINHRTGEIVKTYTAEAFFAYHHINAWEDEKGDIFFDITAFSNADHVFQFYLGHMREGARIHPCSNIRRYRVPIATGGDVSYTVANPACHDLPRINENYLHKPNRYVYAAGEYQEGDMYNCIIKMDTSDPTAETKTWAIHDHFPSEPLFVGRPGATEEDDGVILDVVLDGPRAQSFLLVLDARTFEELARAYVPPAIPFMSHGHFYEKL